MVDFVPLLLRLSLCYYDWEPLGMKEKRSSNFRVNYKKVTGLCHFAGNPVTIVVLWAGYCTCPDVAASKLYTMVLRPTLPGCGRPWTIVLYMCGPYIFLVGGLLRKSKPSRIEPKADNILAVQDMTYPFVLVEGLWFNGTGPHLPLDRFMLIM